MMRRSRHTRAVEPLKGNIYILYSYKNSYFCLQRSIADPRQTKSQIDISHDRQGFILHSTVLQRNFHCKRAYVYIYIYIILQYITSPQNISGRLSHFKSSLLACCYKIYEVLDATNYMHFVSHFMLINRLV